MLHINRAPMSVLGLAGFFVFVAAPKSASAAPPAIYNLGTLGGDGSAGSAVNADGQVAGWSSTTNFGGIHAFLYTGTPGSGGAMADLGTLAGKNSYANGINNAGQVTGYSDMTDASDSIEHAFLYSGIPGSGGAMVDLGTLGGAASEAFAINRPAAAARWLISAPSAGRTAKGSTSTMRGISPDTALPPPTPRRMPSFTSAHPAQADI